MKESQECKIIYEEVCDNSYEEKVATATSQVDEYGAPLAPKCRKVARETCRTVSTPVCKEVSKNVCAPVK